MYNPNAPSRSKRAKRKAKLKMRYKECLDQEIARSRERLELLTEIKHEISPDAIR